MFGTQNLSAFLLAAISLNLLPGADTLYIIARSIAQGRKAGIVSVLGISTGSLLHTTAAAFGLSAILATSAIAFTIVKLIGATYLVYLGIKMFINNSSPDDMDIATENKNLWTIYRQGILTNILNPKVALFFLALLPQFVDSATNYQMFSFLFLGCLFITTGTLWCMFVALLAAKASNIIRSQNLLINIANKITGVIFIGLGIKLATEQAK
ncbi:MAG: LysE family translocator [Pleurocapsa sp. MO_226.B13]|nr:LysE family translocator [Pleurocapsa sp. MO_226.B13]